MKTGSYIFQLRTAIMRVSIYLLKISLTVYGSVLVINYFNILPNGDKVDAKDLLVITLGTCVTELFYYIYRRHHSRHNNSSN